MPYDLLVKQNQLFYSGQFSRPLFELWGDSKTLIRGAYQALSPYGACLSGISLESVPANTADHVVSVNLGFTGVHRFRYDRVESTFFNFTEELYVKIPAILEDSVKWIRAAVPSFEFASHQFVYSGHSEVKSLTVEAVLKAVGPKGLKSGGVDRGSGVIFHWNLPERNWATQLLLDHSVVLQGGLYIMFTLFIAMDHVNYNTLADEGRSYLIRLLSELGLNFAASST